MSYRRLNKSVKNVKNKSLHNEKYKSNNRVFVRKRKMDFNDFVWYLIMQKGRSSSMELDEYLKNKNGTYEISISKQAFSKQRQNLSPQIFIDIYKEYLEDFYQNYPKEVKKYKGYNICAIDGSHIEIPNTIDLRSEYKASTNRADSRKVARAKVSGIYDVENGFMIDALITEGEEGEEKLAERNIENAEKIINLKKSIIIFDRGYPGIQLLWYLEKKKAKYIMRLPKNSYKKERDEMKTEDEWLEIKISGYRLNRLKDKEIKEELKEKKKLRVRITKVVLDTGEIEYLLSNIPKEIIGTEEMKDMYFRRWQIEIGYDILKNKLHIENFTGRSKITIEQDFYAQIYTFNILQDIKNTNTKRIQEKQISKNLRYRYKVNTNILAGWLKNILIAIMFIEDGEEQEKLYNIIVQKAEKNLIAIKPNRSNIRKPYVSRRNKYRTNLRNNM